MITFLIPGSPQGKARARTYYNANLKRTITMTPDKTANYENLIKLSFIQQKPAEFEQLSGELRMEIKAFYQVPKSASKKVKQFMLEGHTRPTKKPDADNVIKVIADALNGIAYYDDRQIVELSISKHYSEIPRVVVTLGNIAETLQN